MFKGAPRFDAHRLQTGIFIYRNLKSGQDVGNARITVQEIAGSGSFRFANVVTGKFSQRWEALTTSTLSPISARLSFGEGTVTPTFDLHYRSGRVVGFVVGRRAPNAGIKRPVDELVPSSVVDQRVDWAAASAIDLQRTREFEFDVYDPVLGVSQVFARVGRLQSVRVPVREFVVYPVTYEIKKRSGTETY